MSYRPQLLPTDLAALAAGVKPGTIRNWRHLGILEPAGGSGRKPLFNLADVIDAKNAPKTRDMASRAKAA